MCAKSFSVAIDGPGGAGKSTVAKLLARELNYIYVDTGAMYRAVALFCINNGIPFLQDEIEKHLHEVDISIKYVDCQQRIFLNRADVSEEIRTPEVSEGSSKVAVFPNVREKLVKLQRKMAQDANIIMDGRDIGTYVLPSANVKIYLDAGVDFRAQRRVNELKARGIDADFETTKKEVELRDYRDMNREFAPLKRAENAVLLDTSHMNLQEVIDKIKGLIYANKVEG